MEFWAVNYGLGPSKFRVAVLVVEGCKLVDAGVEDEEKSHICRNVSSLAELDLIKSRGRMVMEKGKEKNTIATNRELWSQ